jgi:hypothetical protein
METYYMKIAPSLKKKRVKIPHVQKICSLSSLAEEKNKKMVRRNKVIEMCGSGKHFFSPVNTASYKDGLNLRVVTAESPMIRYKC